MAQLNTAEVIKATKSTSVRPKFWHRQSVKKTVTALLVYTILIGLSIIVLMPLSWMLTAALRGQGEPVNTIPVSWVPTESFHFENFWIILTNPAYPLWRPFVNTLMLIALNVTGV